VTRSRGWTIFALVGWTVAVVGGVSGLVVRVAWPVPILPTTFGVGPTALVAIAVLGITWTTVGALLVIRRPENQVGRIMVLVGVVHAMSVLTVAVAFAALAEGTAEGRDVASLVGGPTALVTPTMVLVCYLGFIFPTGRGHTSGWDRIGHIALGVGLILATLLVFQPGDIHLLPGISNPVGFGPDLRPVFGGRVAGGVAVVAAAFIAPLVALSVVSRYRMAGRVERHQLKWSFLAIAITTGALIVLIAVTALTRGPAAETPLTLFALAATTVPIAIGIAILRYRLFEIDRIISRTLSYTIVTIMLAAVFVLVVIGLQEVLALFTGGTTIAVAASTLVVATLFQPLRRRVQRAVDRRFDRSRYDSERIAAAFATRLRDEVDLDRLRRELVETAVEAVRPDVATVWLRPSSRGGPA
jgi:hypothetical protein